MVKNGRVIVFDRPVYVKSWASAVGKREAEGPLSKYFDLKFQDDLMDQKSWENAEKELVIRAADLCAAKGEMSMGDLDMAMGGDLLNQCTAASFSMRSFGVPFMGLYGACSTMAESILGCAAFVDGGGAKNALAFASSHFCSAERQYRTPIEYGSQRTPSAQWTVTGCGAVALSNENHTGIRVKRAVLGKVVDLGVCDSSNMGAAMAPAAFDTIATFFKDSGEEPESYDLIVTGDLATVGKEIVLELCECNNIKMHKNYDDCGCMIFRSEECSAGGSGCGCSAAVLTSYILDRLKLGHFKRVLFCGTGALLSPVTSFQGESIPGICHLVELEREDFPLP